MGDRSRGRRGADGHAKSRPRRRDLERARKGRAPAREKLRAARVSASLAWLANVGRRRHRDDMDSGNGTESVLGIGTTGPGPRAATRHARWPGSSGSRRLSASHHALPHRHECAVRDLQACTGPQGRAVATEQSPLDPYISVLTLGELTMDFELAPAGKRREQLQRWVSQDLAGQFIGRILEVDEAVSREWGKLSAFGRTSGRELPAETLNPWR